MRRIVTANQIPRIAFGSKNLNVNSLMLSESLNDIMDNQSVLMSILYDTFVIYAIVTII